MCQTSPLSKKEFAYLREQSEEQALAAQVCLNEGHFNAAASRAYYAIYSAMWAFLGYSPRWYRNEESWHHNEIVDAFANAWKSKHPDAQAQQRLVADIKQARASRIRGDYEFADVSMEEAEAAFETAAECLEKLLGITL